MDYENNLMKKYKIIQYVFELLYPIHRNMDGVLQDIVLSKEFYCIVKKGKQSQD